MSPSCECPQPDWNISFYVLKPWYSGGGIGGLAFAVALAKSGGDFDVDIYESAGSFTEIGAGLNLWPRIEKILTDLGLGVDLQSRYTKFPEDGENS